MKILDLIVHPAALAMPAMSDEEFAVLKADIKKNGQLCAVEIYNGMLIDGIHRAKACRDLGIDLFETDIGHLNGQSAADYVVSLNFARRHLTASQKAAIAAELLPQYEEEAKARQKRKAADDSVPAKLPEQTNGEARQQAATAVGVSPRYVSDAKKLKEEAPEEFAKVKSGELTIAQAKASVAADRYLEDRGPCPITGEGPKKKPRKSDLPGVSNAGRKIALESLETLTRTLDMVGLLSELQPALDTIASRLKRR